MEADDWRRHPDEPVSRLTLLDWPRRSPLM